MTQITEVLIQRLVEKGLLLETIPGFVRDVANTISENRHTELDVVNKRLWMLGWNPIELDYHTFQLLIANLERKIFPNY
jgi:hypothetical protein